MLWVLSEETRNLDVLGLRLQEHEVEKLCKCKPNNLLIIKYVFQSQESNFSF